MTTFRTLALVLSLLTSVTTVLAQAAYEAPLRAQLAKAEAAQSADEMTALVPAFERIAAAHPDAWLPNYYAAHFNLLKHWTSGEDGCKPCLEKTDAFLAKAEAADNNSEVLTLRASYYQGMLQLHPMRAPYYGPKAGNLLEAAAEKDPSNPRAASLLGQNLYYTPAMFGGGADEARPHLARAVELFDAEAADAERSDLLPDWGADRARGMHQKLAAN